MKLSNRSASLLLSRWQSSLSQAALDHNSVLPFTSIPSPPAWPIVGHIPLFIQKDNQKRMDKLFEKLRDEYGDIYRLKAPGIFGDMVALFKPEHIKTMYYNDGKYPEIPGFDFMTHMRKTIMKDRYVSAGLISNGEEWYDVRNKLQQDMMRPKSALYYLSEIEDIALELTDKLQEISKDNMGVVDVDHIVHEYALESVGCVFMGTRLGAMAGNGESQRLIEVGNKSFEEMQPLMWIPKPILPVVPAYKRFIAAQSECFDICKKHIVAAIANVKESDETLISKIVKKCGQDSPIPLIMGIDALQVGIDTTGTTANWILYHLASNPDKQEKLYQEICNVIGPDGNITESSLVKMKYLKACQTESQRIAPAIFGSSRRAPEDFVLGGYHIPKGTTLVRCGSTSSNDPANFNNPEKFLPERWLRGCPEKHDADSFANIPWGHGARSCIGRRFAQLELYVMMIKVIQKFKIDYTGEEINIIMKGLSIPDKPVNITFKLR